MDYIDAEIDGDLSLETLSSIAHFSPFHFHRIFHAMTGETLNRYIQRIRIEKAASLLVQNPNKSITVIALDCGFSGSAAFARAFREAFGMSASEWRSTGGNDRSKISKTIRKESQQDGKNGKAFSVSAMYFDDSTNTLTWRMTMNDRNITVEVKDMPEFTVAYIRHIGPYKGNSALFEELFGRLMAWAGPRGLMETPDLKCLAVYHDNPDITEDSKLRLSVCISVPVDTEVEGEIGKMAIPGGKYAMSHFELLPNEYEDAWNAVYGQWLPESSYQPADSPCFELYRNDPKTHPEGRHIVDICIPVKPL